MLSGLQEFGTNITVSLQEKGGIYQAVLSYKDVTNKWKTKWKSTGIKVKPGNKKLAKEKAENIKEKFEIEMKDKLRPKRTGIESQLDMEFIDFMNMRLEETNIKRKYEYDTYAGYKSNINILMREFFGSSQKDNEQQEQRNEEKSHNNKEHIYLVSEVTPDVVDEFFTYLAKDCQLKNTTIKHFRNQISVAYELLDKKNIMSKPTKCVEQLKEELFTPETYTMEELNQLLKHPDDRIKQNVASKYENLIHNSNEEIKTETQKTKRFIVKRRNVPQLKQARA